MIPFIIVGVAMLLLIIVSVVVCTADIDGVTDRNYHRRDK